MIRIVTNTPGFPTSWRSACGVSGKTIFASSEAEFLASPQDGSTILLVNCNPELTLRLAGALYFRRRPALVSADLVLRAPAGIVAHARAAAKRVLLKRVDHFVHYFRDVSGLKKFYGISQKKSSFTPFKANLRTQVNFDAGAGEYVLCFGRSLRDYDTFVEAVEKLPYPAAIAQPDLTQMQAHGTRFHRWKTGLPPNIRVLSDDGTAEAQIRILSGARLVVLPILKTSLVASGISTCLNAMLLRRCVIGSEGPGMSDIFREEVLTVPAEDAAALAATIRRAWEDEELRERVSAAGHRYALAQGGEPELYQRMIDTVVMWYRGRPEGRSF